VSRLGAPSVLALLAGLLVGLVGLVAVPAAAEGPEVHRSNEVVEKRVIGRSVLGRPIVAYRKGVADARRTVVVLGQMHGDERAGVATAEWVRDHVPVRADADVWVVPTMNPDGLARGTRTNAHGVDLNRNWPMNWRPTSRGITWSGPSAASEPETRAMLAFLREVQPDFMTSIHQPYGEVGLYADKPRPFQRRLARALGLPLRGIDIGGPPPPPSHGGGLQPGGSDNAPTLTGWFNAHYPGTAITVEFRRHPSRGFVRDAAHGLLEASLAS
jgi:murein peptide amidase A